MPPVGANSISHNVATPLPPVVLNVAVTVPLGEAGTSSEAMKTSPDVVGWALLGELGVSVKATLFASLTVTVPAVLLTVSIHNRIAIIRLPVTGVLPKTAVEEVAPPPTSCLTGVCACVQAIYDVAVTVKNDKP